MNHKDFLSSLTPEQRQHLTARSDVKGLLHLVGHWGAIAACSTLILIAVPLWPLLLVVQGVLLVFLFTLLHETSHKTPFQSDWINDCVGHICGFIIFLPATWFRYFHFAHHKHTQIPGKDPELDSPKPETKLGYALYVSGLPLWLNHAKTVIRTARGQMSTRYIPTARRAGITREARLYLVGYVALLGLSLWHASTALLYLWLLPALLGQPFLRLYLLAEHGRCPMVANMFENTRTTFTSRFVRGLAWNMPYHTEHHTYPSVPFHRLPELRRLTTPYLNVTANGYAAFNKEYVDEAVK